MSNVKTQETDIVLFWQIELMRKAGASLTHALARKGLSPWRYGCIKQAVRDQEKINSKKYRTQSFTIKSMRNAGFTLKQALTVIGLSDWQYGMIKQTMKNARRV